MTSDENNSPRTGAVGGAGLSLFANLLDPSAPSTISRAPVLFANSTGPEPPRHDTITTEKKSANGSISLLAVKSKCALPSCNLKLTPSLAALRFQPTKRPQIPAQKPRTRANASGPKQISVSVETAQDSSGSAVPSTHTAIKTTIEDWTAVDDDDDNGVLAINNGMRRQRGGKKRRKRGKEDVPVPQNWDDIYDPSRPNKYEDYKQSEERERELRDWKDCLYAHRMLLRKSSSDVADSPADEPGKHSTSMAISSLESAHIMSQTGLIISHRLLIRMTRPLILLDSQSHHRNVLVTPRETMLMQGVHACLECLMRRRIDRCSTMVFCSRRTQLPLLFRAIPPLFYQQPRFPERLFYIDRLNHNQGSQ